MTYEHAWQRLIEIHPSLRKDITIEIDATNLRKIAKFFYDRGVKDADARNADRGGDGLFGSLFKGL